ncbi:major facilitator superfamily domain-containing protein [Penicillium malachiteum]|nr:major facilitator superfamily domain-containing protein [Penicillium malachiteum]
MKLPGTELVIPSFDTDQEAIKVPPEEGLRGWLCIAGSFFAFFASFGFLNVEEEQKQMLSTYQTTVLQIESSSDISWIFALQLALMWAPGPIFGRLVESFGTCVVLVPCSALCVFSLCMNSLAKEYYQIFPAQGLAFGIGAGGVFTTAMLCSRQWFARRRGLAIGIVTSGNIWQQLRLDFPIPLTDIRDPLGGVILPIFFIKVSAMVGFNGSVRYTALFISLLLISACLLVQPLLPRKKSNTQDTWCDFSLLKDKQFALYMAGSWLVMWGLWAPFDFLSSMAEDTGFSFNMSIYLISIINAAFIPGSILPGHLGDRFGLYNSFTVVSMVAGLSIVALWVLFDYRH